MTDWHTFYQCVQDELSWNRFHCMEQRYEDIGTHVIRNGKLLPSKLVNVPIVVPKFLHAKYIQLKMSPTITTEFKRRHW